MLVWIEVILDAGSEFILLKEFDEFTVIQVMSSVGSYYHPHHGFSGNLKILLGVLRVWKGMPVFWADGTANKCPDASCERCCTISGGSMSGAAWSSQTTGLIESYDSWRARRQALVCWKDALNHSWKNSHWKVLNADTCCKYSQYSHGFLWIVANCVVYFLELVVVLVHGSIYRIHSAYIKIVMSCIIHKLLYRWKRSRHFGALAPPEVEADVTRSPKKRRSGSASESAVSCGRHGNWNLPVESAEISRLVKVDELLLKDHLRLYLGFRKWRLNLKFPLEYCDRLLASEWRNIASYRLVNRFSLTNSHLKRARICVCVL